jgi:hypothetical protein
VLSERERGTLQVCGYGLLGLCCPDCLLGPCRVSPFEKESWRGPCGENTDQIVARNLLRLIRGEATLEMNHLVDLTIRLKAWNFSPQSRRGRKWPEKKVLAETYGWRPNVPFKKLTQGLMSEANNLLSPFPEREDSLLLKYLPKKSLPSLYQEETPPTSLMHLLLNSSGTSQGESSEITGVLKKCLNISFFALLSGRLRADMGALIGESGPCPGDGEALANLDKLPDSPTPFMILLSDRESSVPEPISHRVDELAAKLKASVPFVRLNHVVSLFDVARRLFSKWSLPMSEMRTVILVATTQATKVLGPLALGFRIASFPPLPIHGSKMVETFFVEDLRKGLGGAYLLSWEEDLYSKIMGFLS